MNVILFGASGMVGQGVLRECLLDPGVRQVVSVGRSASGRTHSKLHELIHSDLMDLHPIEDRLRGFDACFFCMGVSSAGMAPDTYYRLTYELTLAVAGTLARLNPGMTFVYVSGAGTDSSERGRVRWARVKGKTENALRRLPFKAAYMFRPGAIQPLHGIRSRTPGYRLLYQLAAPLLPLVKAVLPNQITTTERIGRAMIAAARRGAPTSVLETGDINRLAAQA